MLVSIPIYPDQGSIAPYLKVVEVTGYSGL
jgi:hypothetical protein